MSEVGLESEVDVVSTTSSGIAHGSEGLGSGLGLLGPGSGLDIGFRTSSGVTQELLTPI